jgi:hypothetical protein
MFRFALAHCRLRKTTLSSSHHVIQFRWFVSATKTADRLRKTLNQFLLKVHPDLFTKYPQLQVINERSLKQLNAFLDIVEQYSKEGWNNEKPTYFILDKNKVAPRFGVEFWLKKSVNSEKHGASRLMNELGSTQSEEFVKITVEYIFPEEFFSKQTPVWRLEREAALYLSRLYKEANLELSEEALKDLLHTDMHHSLPSSQENTRIRKQTLKHNFHEMLREHLAFVSPAHLLRLKYQKFPSKEYGQYYVESISYTHNSHIFYVPKLTGEQQVSAIERLKLFLENCEEMTPKGVPLRWNEFQKRKLPVLFTEATYIDPRYFPGFIIVPYNFDFEELRDYLLKCLDVAIEQRTQIREEILIWQFVCHQLRQQLNLSSITHKFTSKKIALNIIEELLQNFKKIENIKPLLEGVSFVITDKGQIQLNDIRNTPHKKEVEDNMSPNSEAVSQTNNNNNNSIIYGSLTSQRVVNKELQDSRSDLDSIEFFPNDGILILPTTVNSDKLIEFVKKNEQLFIYWNQVNPFSKKYQQEVRALLHQMTILLKCKEIRFAWPVFLSKRSQLIALKLLHSNWSFFAKLPLSDITIVVSDIYRLDKSNKILTLPYNFHIKTLRHYLHFVLPDTCQ